MRTMWLEIRECVGNSPGGGRYRNRLTTNDGFLSESTGDSSGPRLFDPDEIVTTIWGLRCRSVRLRDFVTRRTTVSSPGCDSSWVRVLWTRV